VRRGLLLLLLRLLLVLLLMVVVVVLLVPAALVELVRGFVLREASGSAPCQSARVLL
jgi:hypothetical protein